MWDHTHTHNTAVQSCADDSYVPHSARVKRWKVIIDNKTNCSTKQDRHHIRDHASLRQLLLILGILIKEITLITRQLFFSDPFWETKHVDECASASCQVPNATFWERLPPSQCCALFLKSPACVVLENARCIRMLKRGKFKNYPPVDQNL